MMALAENPRELSEIATNIILDDGRPYSVHAVEVTPRGLVLECGDAELDIIKPRHLEQGARYEHLNVEMKLPLPSRPLVNLDCMCKVSSVRRISQRTFHIDAVFEDMPPAGFKYIAEYIVSQKSK